MIGKTLSHYKVIEKIGQGGMGEVYRAEDTNLSREVAIKVLPEQFTKDPQRLARFEREAKLLAQLNHPNIAAIYGFEEADDVRFLAMELVPGETLAERVAKGPVPVEEALEVCRQIAEGVEAAHEKGVIHRDLKPANVKVTPEGKVKILDFGLAKAFEEETPVIDISQSPTMTEEMTRAGMILGTAAYMSPEQAKGKPVDKRADIFAFGSVLYELLTARRAFQGETITETIAAVLKSEPDWEALPERTPSMVQILIRQCLEKDSNNRLRDIGDFLALGKAVVKADVVGEKQRQKRVPVVLTALVASLLSGLIVWNVVRPVQSPTLPVTRVTFRLPGEQRLVAPQGQFGDRYPPIAFSQDGEKLAYIASTADNPPLLYLRELDRLEARSLPGTENAQLPFFSPDGKWVGFLVKDTVFKVSVDGGNPVQIGLIPNSARGAAWGADNTIFLGGYNKGLLTLNAGGGTPVEITRPNNERGEQYHAWPEVLPDGEHLLFTALTGLSWDIGVLSLKSGESRILEGTDGATQPHYLDSGHLVFFRAGGLFATPFDFSEMKLGEPSIPVLDNPFMGWNAGMDLGYFALSRSGSLAYVPGGAGAGENRIVLVDRGGNEKLLPAEPGRYGYGPSVSPNGDRLAVGNRIRGSTDLWIHELDRSRRTRLSEENANINPVWTADGTRVIFALFKSGSNSFDIYWTPADEGKPEPLLVQDYGQYPTSTSRDGRFLVFHEANPKTGFDIYRLPLEGDRVPSPLMTTPSNEREGTISPDGLFLAYVSDATGQDEVFVKPLDSEGGNTPISTDGGRWPRWASSGDELFYIDGSAMMGVRIEFEPTVRAGTPQKLFEGPYEVWYDVLPGSDQFVMLKREPVELTEVNVVLNWSEELKQLVPTDK